MHHGLKILHILSATLVLTSMAYSYALWRYRLQSENAPLSIQRIQTQTWLIIIPFAVIQLLTGFTMISIHHEDLSQLWIKGSVIAFIAAMGSWIAFVYFLLSAKHNLRLQSILLFICGASLLFMVFFMTSKI